MGALGGVAAGKEPGHAGHVDDAQLAVVYLLLMQSEVSKRVASSRNNLLSKCYSVDHQG